MEFKGKANKVINRFGFKFVSDTRGFLFIDSGKNGLSPINLDELKKRTVIVDNEGNEVVERESISKEEKTELLSAFKAYGFDKIVNQK